MHAQMLRVFPLTFVALFTVVYCENDFNIKIPSFQQCITKPWPEPSKHQDGVIKQASIVCVNDKDEHDVFYLCDELKNRRGAECLTKNFTRKVWAQLHRDSFYCDIMNPSAQPPSRNKVASSLNKRQLTSTVTNYFHYFTMIWPENRQQQLEYNVCLHVMWTYMCNQQSEHPAKHYNAHLKFDEGALVEENFLSHGLKIPPSRLMTPGKEPPLMLLPGTLHVSQSITNNHYTLHLRAPQGLDNLHELMPSCVNMNEARESKRVEARESRLRHTLPQTDTATLPYRSATILLLSLVLLR